MPLCVPGAFGLFGWLSGVRQAQSHTAAVVAHLVLESCNHRVHCQLHSTQVSVSGTAPELCGTPCCRSPGCALGPVVYILHSSFGLFAYKQGEASHSVSQTPHVLGRWGWHIWRCSPGPGQRQGDHNHQCLLFRMGCSQQVEVNFLPVTLLLLPLLWGWGCWT